MQKKAKVYVAGHTGLAGSAIMRQLDRLGYGNVVVRTHGELELTDQNAVEVFFAEEKPEYVFVAAAKVGGIMANDTYRGEFIYENLMIQTNIMHQSMVHGVKRLVFLGSSCAYPKLAPQPLGESSIMTGPIEPTNAPYGMAKLAGIEMCDAYNRQYETAFVPVMPTNIYGPGDSYDLEKSHVLPALMRKFHLGKLAMEGDWDQIEADVSLRGPIPDDIKNSIGLTGRDGSDCSLSLWGSGAPLREFMHADDMADGCIYAMFNMDCTDLVNIGTGQEVSIKEAAEIVAEVVGYTGRIEWDTTKPDGSPRKLLDVTRLKELGWTSKVSLREGLEATYVLYLKGKSELPVF